ncbi:MAG: MBL fold metallo-hydrolase [Clostridia bacterium]|nr:MBL fold metallo-hydrolase [Clostridia bacterium]
MLIKVLLENTSISEEVDSEHGLSLYIETAQGCKILFDTGSSALFSRNAEKMGVKLAEVDLGFLSHGHFDHGGGLSEFLKINSAAPFYVHPRSFEERYGRQPDGSYKYIGIAPELAQENRLLFTQEYQVLETGLELFSNVQGDKLVPTSNKDLLKKVGDTYQEDDFLHEQNLVILEGEQKVLIAGCAHRGIINILEAFYQRYQCWPTQVLGGFHLSNPMGGAAVDQEMVQQIAEFLLSTGSQYYTGHCTGQPAYAVLKEIMGDKLDYLAGGSVWEF